ncbi:MAG: histidine ammonia-lyase [Planctomycetota bacterium]
MPQVTLDTLPLNVADVLAVARAQAKVSIAPKSAQAMASARKGVDAALRDGLAHYGLNTGFGSLARTRIAGDQLRALQRNLVRSHAAGVGEPLATEVVRGTMLILAASLCRGLSGVRPVVVQTIVAFLNAGLTPVVPEVGSVGASGDLAPLAHIALALIGDGEVFVGDSRKPISAAKALAGAKIESLVLEAKEGLALINGTHLMAARAALAMADFDALFTAALAAAAMSIDACRATDAFLDPRAAAARNHPGVAFVASSIRTLLKGSTIIPSHREDDPRVQDPYSLRCMPQVLGAAHDAAEFVRASVAFELGAVTDNPLVMKNGDLVSAGNFHGMPIAIPLDTLAIAVAHVAGISERRTFLLLAAADPEAHLRPYLSPHPGVCSGLMIAQYTAAACCNEIIGLANPASVVNLSTSAGMEDYNSFGPRSAAKVARALELATNVVAIELLCAAQALEYHRPLRSGKGVEKAFAAVRSVVPPLTDDRPPSPDIAAIAGLIRSGAF